MKAFIFDTETTDLVTNNILRDEHQPRVIEFYGVVTDDTEEVFEEIDFLCDPGIVVTPETTKITGIKHDDVKGLPPFSAHESSIRFMMSRAEVFVAHNLSFDKRILELEFRRCGTLDVVEWPRPLCTVEQTEWIKGYRLRLADLHAYLFGQTFEGAHRAKNDVMALKRCYHELRRRGEI